MIFVKVKNLVTKYGNYDYKGLDLGNIVAGTQVYPYNMQDDNYCLLGVTKTVEHDDIQIISEELYLEEKKKVEDAYPVIESEESKIERLEKEALQLKKMNEELRQTTLIALEGVAILNEEVQQIKKNSEASAN